MAVISGDGVFSHVFLGAVDTAVSAKFYDAALAALGIKKPGAVRAWVDSVWPRKASLHHCTSRQR